jgi:hypothetical protein
MTTYIERIDDDAPAPKAMLADDATRLNVSPWAQHGPGGPPGKTLRGIQITFDMFALERWHQVLSEVEAPPGEHVRGRP